MAIKYPTLQNAAAAGMISGIQTGRLPITDASGEPVEPSDFSGLVTAAFLFSTEFDTVLQTVVSPPSNLASLISASGVTQVPATAAESNAAESLPPAVIGVCKALFEGRSWPLLNATTGAPFAAADYATLANTAVSLFVEYAANTTNT